MFTLLNYKTIKDWSQNNPVINKPRRDMINLCVIDDEGFEKDSMLKLKFNRIRVMDKFNNLDDFEPYNVILCDIKGVGNELDGKLEGIALAKEIKKIYPEKIVIQYSGQSVHDYDPYFYKDMSIDGFIDKNLSTQKLVDELDKKCCMLWDPCEAWNYIEKNLRRMGIYNKNIAYFEHLFVKSLEKKKNYLLNKKYDVNLKTIKTIALGFLNLGINVLNIYIESRKI